MPRFTHHPDLDRALAQEFRKRHLELFDKATFIANNNEQVVKSFHLSGQDFIIKRYPEKSPLANFRSILGISRAMNSFTKSTALSTLGISSPAHLFVARHLGILHGVSYLIMRKSTGVPLTSIIDNHPSPPFPDQLMDILTGMIKTIHDAGLTHGDLHAANIFVLPDLSLELIDLDSMRPNHRRQHKDIARILRSFDHQPDLQVTFSHTLQKPS